MAEVAIVLLVVFAVLLLINVPVAVAIGVASLVAVFANGGAVQPEMIVADRMINGVASFSLLAIPFFVLSGILMIMMLEGGMTSPVVAAVVVTATLNSRLYPMRFISGIMNPPTLDTAAVAEPEMEPNSIQVSTFT